MELEQKLEQSKLNTTNSQLAELERKALEMAKYYYKGFGNSFTAIMGLAYAYLEHERKESLNDSYDTFKKIEDFYAAIPFDNLHGKEEFYPLFVVKRLLPKFRERMDKVFKENKKNELRNLQYDGSSIVKVGILYGESLLQLLDEIRLFPEGKDFRVAIPDQNKDYIWHF